MPDLFQILIWRTYENHSQKARNRLLWPRDIMACKCSGFIIPLSQHMHITFAGLDHAKRYFPMAFVIPTTSSTAIYGMPPNSASPTKSGQPPASDPARLSPFLESTIEASWDAADDTSGFEPVSPFSISKTGHITQREPRFQNLLPYKEMDTIVYGDLVLKTGTCIEVELRDTGRDTSERNFLDILQIVQEGVGSSKNTFIRATRFSTLKDTSKVYQDIDTGQLAKNESVLYYTNFEKAGEPADAEVIHLPRITFIRLVSADPLNVPFISPNDPCPTGYFCRYGMRYGELRHIAEKKFLNHGNQKNAVGSSLKRPLVIQADDEGTPGNGGGKRARIGSRLNQIAFIKELGL